MKENNVVTLPITKQNRLEGLITIGDIANSYMDVYDSRILATAHTKYKNILETLDAKMVVGNEEEYFTTHLKYTLVLLHESAVEHIVFPH